MLSAAGYIASNALDPEVIKRNCVTLGVLPVAFDGRGYFEFDDDDGGERAPFIGVLEAGELIDICAWRPDDPRSLATQDGCAFALGIDQLTDPLSWFAGERLMVHRSPLRWLKAGCRGIVPLNHEFGFVALRRALGDLEAEDEEHAFVLDELINPAPFPHQIMVPA